jgi:pimeloyl-ACP methyl ester carboxylesterase
MLKKIPMFLALATGSLFGCTGLVQYRTDYTPCMITDPARDCPNQAIQEYRPAGSSAPGYLMGFIEFDDQGQLFDQRAQMTHVMARVDEDAASGEDLIMVVFVHGWKHNAHTGDDNIGHFRQGIYKLSETEFELSQAQGRRARRVVGIYVGWRGLSATAPVLKELTFWDRKNTAHKVGHGEVTEILNRLEQIRRTKDALAANGKSNSRLVIIGHSFGAAVVYSSVEQILESRFVQTAGPAGSATDVEGFGNLVVLVNPAFEALLYMPLRDLSTERGTYFASQLPVLAILTSEADDATKIAFPTGRWFSTRFEKERDVTRYNPISHSTETIDEAGVNITAVGHFEPFRTHYLRAEGKAASGVAITASESAQSQLRASQSWEDDHPGSTIDFIGSQLTRTDNSAGRDPYLLIKVDKALIPNHNDIWDDRVREFVTQLILIAGQNVDLNARKSERQLGYK